MTMSKKYYFFCFLFFLLVLASGSRAQFLIIEQNPAPNSTTANSTDVITITFNSDVNGASLDEGVFVYGSISGRIKGRFSVSSNVVSFVPDRSLDQGERVDVSVTTEVAALNGDLLDRSYHWSYFIRPVDGSFDFDDPITYSLRPGSEPSGIIAADLSNNNAPDLVVVNSNNTLITVLENRMVDSDEFLIVDEIDTGVEIIEKIQNDQYRLAASGMPVNTGIIAADLDSDGNTDIVTTSTLSNQLIILRNDTGDPGSLGVDLINTGERPVDVIAGDFNGNGFLDLSVVSYGRDRVYIHFNDGTGNFGSPVFYEVGLAPIAIAAEDVNDNGFLDLVIAVSGDNRVEALVNQGDGTFINELLISDLDFSPSFMVTGNFVRNNSENMVDIVLGSSDERIFYIYENNEGNFRLSESRTTGAASRPLSAASADVDRDGIPDLITTHFSSDDLLISTFDPNTIGGEQITVSDDIVDPFGVVSADLNVRGAMDLAVTNASTHSVTIFINKGDPERCEGIIEVFGYPEVVDFGRVEVNSTADTLIQLINGSEIAIEVTLELLHGANFAIESSGTFVMNGNSSRQIGLSFSPEQVIAYADELFLRLNLPCGEHILVIDLIGEGVTPAPDLVATSLAASDMTTAFFTLEQYTFTGEFINDSSLPVTDPFDVAFYVDNVLQSRIRVNRDIEPGETVSYDFNHIFTQTGVSTISFVVDVEDEIEETDKTNNSIAIQVDVQESLPDLFAKNFVVLDQVSEYLVGVEYRFFAEIENIGRIPVDESFSVVFSVDGVVESTTRVTERLEPDEDLGLRFNHTFTRPGMKEVSVIIDPTDEIKELDTTNNQATIRLPLRGQIIDLIAESFSPVTIESDYLVGVPYSFSGSLRYRGDLPLNQPFDVIFTVNGVAESIFRVRDELEDGQRRSFSFEHSFDEDGTFELAFVVDPMDEIGDSDRTNNQRSLSLNIREGQVFVTPNPFTPNNDGFNDAVQFDLTQIPNIQDPRVQIFSFNGRLVKTLSAEAFDGSSLHWDGKDDNGNVLRPGVYLYVIQNNNSLVHRGAVTLAL